MSSCSPSKPDPVTVTVVPPEYAPCVGHKPASPRSPVPDVGDKTSVGLAAFAMNAVDGIIAIIELIRNNAVTKSAAKARFLESDVLIVFTIAFIFSFTLSFSFPIVVSGEI